MPSPSTITGSHLDSILGGPAPDTNGGGFNIGGYDTAYPPVVVNSHSDLTNHLDFEQFHSGDFNSGPSFDHFIHH